VPVLLRAALVGLALLLLVPTAWATSPSATAAEVPDLVDALPATVLGAHRTAALEAPEGSVRGIEKALAAGSKVVDLDVRSLSDGELVVSHDPTTTRLATARRRVADLTLAQWSGLTLDVWAWFGDVPAVAPLTLRRVLERYAGRVVLLVEVKTAAAMAGAIDLVLRTGSQGSVVLQSNDPAVVRQARDAGLHAGLWRKPAQLATDDPATWLASGAEQLTVRSISTAAQVDRAVASGLPVWVSAVNRPAQAAALLARGVSGLLSDAPAYTFGRTTWRRTLPLVQYARSLQLRRGATGYVEGRVQVPALGTEAPGARVAVTVAGTTVRTRSDATGRFRVAVRAPSTVGTYRIRVASGDTTVTRAGSEVEGWTFRGTARVDGGRPVLTVVR
jgi:glycerophosphoryl diester phosphodiesterase